MLDSLAPALFVFFWSTGFIVARGVLPHADAEYFLFVRFVAVAAVWGLAACMAHSHWPARRNAAQHLGVGAIMMGLYLALSFWAVAHGLPAGIMALLGALQPLFTAGILMARGREPPSASVWSGLSIGLLGVVLVLWPRLHGTRLALANSANFAGLLAIVGLTIGTLAQRRLSRDDLRAASCLQNIGAAIVALLAVGAAGVVRWDGSGPLWGFLAWSVFISSVSAQGLLLWMMRRTGAAHVTALMLLVPPVAAGMAYLFFHETLDILQLLGFVLALAGVVLARRIVPRDAF